MPVAPVSAMAGMEGGEEVVLHACLSILVGTELEICKACEATVPRSYAGARGPVQIFSLPPILLSMVAVTWCPGAWLRHDMLVWWMFELQPCVQQKVWRGAV